MSKSNDNKNNEIKLGNITLIHNEKGLAITPNENHLFMSADEMFEELGYKRIEKGVGVCYRKEYKIKGSKQIIFMIDQTISVCEENEKGLAVNRDWFSMEELKAINLKCKELRWI